MSAPAFPLKDAAIARQQALGWFVRRQDAAWRGEDEHAFQDWLAASPTHGDVYAQCAAQWQAFDGMPADLVAGMRRQLAHDKKATQVRVEPARRRFLKPAFALGAAFAMGGAGYVAWQQMLAQPVWVEAFATDRGQQKEVALPDGSRLRLDTTTRVEVRYFRDRREVHLVAGQAVFAVQSDTNRPFDVLAGPLRVTVVGTRFSVRHTPGQPGRDGVSVAVEEGKVRVARADSAADGAVYLIAGQRVGSDPAGVLGPVHPVSVEGIAPWREQRISFVDVRLDQALAELARYGDTGLVIHDADVAALRLSGTFDPLNRATLRLALPRVLPVRLVDQGAVTEVRPAH